VVDGCSLSPGLRNFDSKNEKRNTCEDQQKVLICNARFEMQHTPEPNVRAPAEANAV
jgi:hypothetical protein